MFGRQGGSHVGCYVSPSFEVGFFYTLEVDSISNSTIGMVSFASCRRDLHVPPQEFFPRQQLRAAMLCRGLRVGPALGRQARLPAGLAVVRRSLSTAHAPLPDAQEGGTVVCVTSGKGGVGKTTTSASLAMGLAERGFRVCAVDFDIGLRNLDLHLGCERRIVFDFVNAVQRCQTRRPGSGRAGHLRPEAPLRLRAVTLWGREQKLWPCAPQRSPRTFKAQIVGQVWRSTPGAAFGYPGHPERVQAAPGADQGQAPA